MDVLGQTFSPVFKDEAVKNFLDCLTLEDGSKRLSRNSGN